MSFKIHLNGGTFQEPYGEGSEREQSREITFDFRLNFFLKDDTLGLFSFFLTFNRKCCHCI